MHDQIPRLTVAVGVVHQGLLLLGQMRSARDELLWALPTTTIAMGESLEQCAGRCAQAAAGLKLLGVQRGPLHTEDGQRTQFVWAHAVDGALAGKEWSWQRWYALPQPLHPLLITLRETGQVPSGVQWAAA